MYSGGWKIQLQEGRNATQAGILKRELYEFLIYLHLSQLGFVHIVLLDTQSLTASRALQNVNPWLIPKGHRLHTAAISFSLLRTALPLPLFG